MTEKSFFAGAQLSTAWSGVDEKIKNGVTHKKSNPRQEMREGFSLSGASGIVINYLIGNEVIK